MVTLFGQGFDSPRLHKGFILPKDLGPARLKSGPRLIRSGLSIRRQKKNLEIQIHKN